MIEPKARGDLFKSVAFAPVVTVSNAAFGIVLVGILAREGGLPMVGRWAILQVAVTIVLVFDLGLTIGLSKLVSSDGAWCGFSIAAGASVAPLAFAMIGIATAICADLADMGDLIVGLAIAAAAGGVQLIAQWWGAVQSGAHRNLYTLAGSLLMGAVQLGTVVLAIVAGLELSIGLLAATIAISRLSELLFTIVCLRFSPLDLAGWVAQRSRVVWREIWSVARGFSLYSALLKSRLPLYRTLVGSLGGEAAVGVFAIIQRLPEAVASVVSAGLRPMLPAYIRVSGRDASHRLLQTGLMIQVAFCLPLLFVVVAHAPAVLLLWIGEADPSIVFMTRAMCAAEVTVALSAPLVWALLAKGDAHFLAMLQIGQAVILMLAGFGAFYLELGGMTVFVLSYAVLITVSAVAIFVKTSFAIMDWRVMLRWVIEARAGVYIFASIAAAWVSATGGPLAEPPAIDLALRLGGFGVASLALIYLTLKPRRKP